MGAQQQHVRSTRNSKRHTKRKTCTLEGRPRNPSCPPQEQLERLERLQGFQNRTGKIISKIDSIKVKIQSCMGGPEPGENTTEQNATEQTGTTEQTPTSPTCFDNVAKIAADLKEKRALLARYQKVKGWIPPSSALNAKIPVKHFVILFTLY
ncbi:unnamed protein product [Trypanosoma congolense IL3000]|uniref:WGS project CAEQ00000000 data, annotated contig 1572 n=1 Tax=Trypanosoma congolense (strain IL3000) TaxID=1068625 RepID=F9W756_TRYCI|nr:unnamed protein product [Trypanosoma congolense IL3000]